MFGVAQAQLQATEPAIVGHQDLALDVAAMAFHDAVGALVELERFGQFAECTASLRIDLEDPHQRGCIRSECCLTHLDGARRNWQRLGRSTAFVQQCAELRQRTKLMALQWTLFGLRQPDRLAQLGFRGFELIEPLENMPEQHVTRNELWRATLELPFDVEQSLCVTARGHVIFLAHGDVGVDVLDRSGRLADGFAVFHQDGVSSVEGLERVVEIAL